MKMLVSLLQGSIKERLATRLLTSLEFTHVSSHLQALRHIMQLADGVLQEKIQTAIEVEVAAMEALLKQSKGVDWKPLSKAALKQRREDRLATVKAELGQDAFRFTVVVQKLAAFYYPPDKEQTRASILPVLRDRTTMGFFLERLGEVEVIRELTGDVEMHYFPVPPERMVLPIHKKLMYDVEGVLDRADRAEPQCVLSIDPRVVAKAELRVLTLQLSRCTGRNFASLLKVARRLFRLSSGPKGKASSTCGIFTRP
eukprot:COSAG02_NODE_3711_length_6341_cov_4.360622_6_plen_256_part_00